MEPLEAELRKVEKAELWTLVAAAAVAVLSMLFLVYSAVSMGSM